MINSSSSSYKVNITSLNASRHSLQRDNDNLSISTQVKSIGEDVFLSLIIKVGCSAHDAPRATSSICSSSQDLTDD